MLALFYLLNPNTKIGIFPFDTLTRSDSLTSLAQPTYFFSSFFQVQILMEAVSYIDQLHHKLLHQIHSVGLPPQLIKGEKVFFMNFHSICSIVQNYLTRHVHIKKTFFFLDFYTFILQLNISQLEQSYNTYSLVFNQRPWTFTLNIFYTPPWMPYQILPICQKKIFPSWTTKFHPRHTFFNT